MLLIFDPISAYLGGTDSHSNAEVRGLLAPLSELAARTGVAIIAINHMRKSSGSPIYRSMGSLAFAAAARAVWGVDLDPEDQTKHLMLRIKGNLAKQDIGGLAFNIVDNGEGIPYINWLPDVVTLRANDLMSGESSREERSEQADAAAWLREVLTSEVTPASVVRTMARDVGFGTWKTIQRAASIVGVVKSQIGFHGGWGWSLPDTEDIGNAQGTQNPVTGTMSPVAI